MDSNSIDSAATAEVPVAESEVLAELRLIRRMLGQLFWIALIPCVIISCFAISYLVFLAMILTSPGSTP
jgi:hypothetical protein